MEASGDITSTEGCLFGWCLKCESNTATVIIKDGNTEILFDTLTGADTSNIVNLDVPIQFKNKISVTISIT